MFDSMIKSWRVFTPLKTCNLDRALKTVPNNELLLKAAYKQDLVTKGLTNKLVLT